jgi:hypothetical protein
LRLKSEHQAEIRAWLGHAPVGVLGIRISELKHAIGLTKLSYPEREHAAVGVLGREAVGVLKGRPRLSHHVSHCNRAATELEYLRADRGSAIMSATATEL